MKFHIYFWNAAVLCMTALLVSGCIEKPAVWDMCDGEVQGFLDENGNDEPENVLNKYIEGGFQKCPTSEGYQCIKKESQFYCIRAEEKPLCAFEEIICGADENKIECVNPRDNSNHCGSCGNVCGDGSKCVNGKCETSCQDGQIVCGGICVNPKNDRFWCGAKENCIGENAGLVCQEGEVCKDGECATSCLTGQTECDGICVNLLTDFHHCGSCGNVCEEGKKCSDGECRTTCSVEQVECGGTCVNLLEDSNHCGSCGNACGDGKKCSNGECKLTCHVSQTVCGDVCADLKTDSSHCGSCGNACETGFECDGGQCKKACSEGEMRCDDVCVNVTRNNDQCGTCGNTCESGSLCVDGTCTPCGSDGYIKNYEYYDGNEYKKADLYCISSLEQLQSVSQAINSSEHYPDNNTKDSYYLKSSIKIPNSVAWKPIGYRGDVVFGQEIKDTDFTGVFVFDKNAKISGVLRSEYDYNAFGFFGAVRNAVITGASFEFVQYDAKNSANCGVLAGIAENSYLESPKLYTVTISNSLDSIKDTLSIGGLIGLSDSTRIRNLSADVIRLSFITQKIKTQFVNIGGIIGNMIKSRFENNMDLKINMIDIDIDERPGLQKGGGDSDIEKMKAGMVIGDLHDESSLNHLNVTSSKLRISIGDNFMQFFGTIAGNIEYAHLKNVRLADCQFRNENETYSPLIGGIAGRILNSDVSSVVLENFISNHYRNYGILAAYSNSSNYSRIMVLLGSLSSRLFDVWEDYKENAVIQFLSVLAESAGTDDMLFGEETRPHISNSYIFMNYQSECIALFDQQDYSSVSNMYLSNRDNCYFALVGGNPPDGISISDGGVLMTGDKTLTEALNNGGDDWVSAKCEMISEYDANVFTVPVLNPDKEPHMPIPSKCTLVP